MVKGLVADKVADESQRIHYVDGLSGATITCAGISEMIKRCLTHYEPFLKNPNQALTPKAEKAEEK